MNIASSLFGVSQLKTINTFAINNETITLQELIDFWIEGHEKLNTIKEKISKVESLAKKEIEVSNISKMEKVSESDLEKTKRNRSDNETQTKKRRKSSSSKSK